ncbi:MULTISPECIES: chemotaxis protein CheW [unclassified Herbaspirillum]|nr:MULTISPECIES: chemotaxis protein CheW [unclassified Herbaspirillum]RFB73661.1 chemotaxis protein CheW [Herbaspirillum sp. 3R-3a1]TFI10536.1 purine-binding chemotaxis protein CheW [Herbaspirillum sp. 3R11]TFI16441.1 purine-binding chemotaxis protein CheW [Herbaspirillum sp. 3R-11]
MSDFASAPFVVEIAVDDCWNRIGVRGDNSCAKLKEYFRCLNCPTFASAASALLDRPVFGDEAGAGLFVPKGEGEAQVRGRGDATASMLAFRVGAEWLAFPTAAVVEVIEARAVHSLPGQANPAVLGLTNIRGALKICVSLGRMLGMADADTDTDIASAKTAQRLLVVEHEQQVLVFPVNEVAGVYGYAADAVQPPPSTMAHAGMTYTQSLISWRDRQLGLLDCGLLFYALNRSLT